MSHVLYTKDCIKDLLCPDELYYTMKLALDDDKSCYSISVLGEGCKNFIKLMKSFYGKDRVVETPRGVLINPQGDFKGSLVFEDGRLDSDLARRVANATPPVRKW